MVKINSKQHITKNGKIKNNPKKISYPKKIKNDFGIYELTLVTEENVYYTNPSESDENANTIIYNRDMKLLSDNIFAYNSFIEDIIRLYPTKSWVWASKTFMENAEDGYNLYNDE